MASQNICTTCGQDPYLYLIIGAIAIAGISIVIYLAYKYRKNKSS